MSSLFDLTGKVAIVTGSTKGIGLAIATRMAEHGATVVVSSRKPNSCQAVAAAIREKGHKAIVIPCHIGRKEELQALVDRTVAECGGIDILVENAAVNPHLGPSAGMPDEAFDRVMGSNVRSNVWLANMAIPHMVQRGGGAVIIICRSEVCVARRNSAPMRSPRLPTCSWPATSRWNGGRRISAPMPSPPAWCARISPVPCGKIRRCTASAPRDTPLQRIGEPDEIAGAAVFLASAAGSFTTGQTIVIDGGTTAGSVISHDD